MWRDREEEEKEGRRRERNRIYERGDLGGLDGLEEVEDVGRGRGKRGGELGYEMGISGTVVDVEGEEESGEEKERKDEEEEWFAYDVIENFGRSNVKAAGADRILLFRSFARGWDSRCLTCDGHISALGSSLYFLP